MESTTSKPPDSRISHSDALTYWNSISPTVDGMLGGYPQVSRIDLRGSANFLAKLRRQFPGSGESHEEEPLGRGVDCGAGIGRVTAGFLSKVCKVVDIVEPVEKFATEAGKTVQMAGNGPMGAVYVMGLEDWKPAENQYDLIWNQWCLGHLTDSQLKIHLGRCREALTPQGWIVVKENMSSNRDGTDIFDIVDSSVTRTDQKFKRIIQEAGLVLVKTELQTGFPKLLYPVRFYALRPDDGL